MTIAKNVAGDIAVAIVMNACASASV